MSGIKDIAKKAGVSISTVSYALNGSDKVSEKTRNRITKIANELNYTPNLAGKTLKRQKTNIIGVYVHDFSGYFYSHVVDGISSTLKKFGYETIICTGGSQARLFIPQRLVDGAIIIDPNFPDEDIVKYSEQDYKIVLMWGGISVPSISHVVVNNAQGARQAIDALHNSGAENYLIVTGPTNSYDSQQRLQASLSEIQKFSNNPVTVLSSNFTIDGGIEMAKYIAKQDLKKLGVFCLNDEMAIGLYEGLAKFKIKAGHDLRIIGFDNDQIGKFLDPQLSTIDYSKRQWGESAAETIMSMIQDGKVQNKIIKTRLIKKASIISPN